MKPLPASFSVYLDGLRLGAAFYVLLFHVMKLQMGPVDLLKYIPDRGHDAVIVFFVLSGYVIAATTDRKMDSGLRGYFLDRAARVYSVALPTLIFSFVVAVFINSIVLSTNQLDIFGWLTDSFINLFFLGQSWSWKKWIPYNIPYWSLCYEVMYYMAFGIFIFWQGIKRYVGLIIVLAIAGPKVLLLMPCWLLGVFIYKTRDKVQLSPRMAWIVAFIAPVILSVVLHKLNFGPFMRSTFATLFGDQKEYLEFSNDFYIDYVTAILISINIYASRYIIFDFPKIISNLFVKGASISFTLYLMHGPMLGIIQNLVKEEERHSLIWFFIAVVVIPLACYLISQYTEFKRSSLRRWLDARLPAFS